MYFTNNGNDIKISINDSTINYNWTAKIEMREYNKHLIVKGHQSSDNIYSYTQENIIDKSLLSLCKSNLQKAIRRKETDKAIRTALAMFDYDQNELLRRLPIIMVEDTFIHPPSFIKLIWWMCVVSKGYKMAISEVEEMLGIIVLMCEGVHSDKYDQFNSKCKASKEFNIFKLDENNPKFTFIWALEIRSLYGGMWIDKQMLKYHQELWHERKINDVDDNTYIVDIANSKDLLQFSKDDILIEAIDYHPFPWISRKMYEKYSKDVFKKFPKYKADYNNKRNIFNLTIWMCRSRINKRVQIDESIYIETSQELQDIYSLFSKELDGLCRWLLNKLFKNEN
jgi:hypothetical protein